MIKKLKTRIEEFSRIKKELSLLDQSGDLVIMHNGHSYIKMSETFNSNLNPAIAVRFHGGVEVIIARRLTYTQIRACGDFSLIETMQDVIDRDGKTPNPKDMIDYSRLQHDLLKKSLISPTYEEIMSLNKYDTLRVEAEKELKELETIINDMDAGTEKEKLKQDYYTAQMNCEFLLPSDFITDVLCYALQQDNSDIKEVTEDMLLEAAIRAANSNKSPADHLPGNFTPFNKEDINNRALIVYYKNKKDMENK